MAGIAGSVVCAVAACPIAAAQTDEAAPPDGQEAGVEAPRSVALSITLGVLIRDERWREAQELIASMTPEERASPEVRFIEAFIARQRGQPLRAIELYQRMLDEDAMLARVRLELAQTFLDIGDERAAEQNFRLALTSALPPETQALVEQQLTRLEQRHRWRYSVNFSVAPDSNVNAATDAEQAYLFGLPFELSDEARRTSGISATGAVAAERAFAAAGPLSILVGGAIQATDNERTEFDDVSVNARLGVQRVQSGSRTAASLTADRRWFGGEELSQSAGAEIEQRFSSGLTVHDINFAASRLDYDARDDRDAWVYAADWRRTRYVSPNFFWRAGAGVRRVEAESGVESFTGARLTAGAFHALPAGLGIWIEPAIEQREFDDKSVVFGATRSDVETSISIRGIKRDARVFGYSPFIGVHASDNDSNVAIYDYSRVRLEFGFTRTF